jgi:hypothetical protein
MRSHCALYVDAGYLLASAATRVAGSSLRGSVNVDQGRLVEGLVRQVEELTGLPLLRVHWYDSGGRPGGQADAAQEALGMQSKVKLRLGRRSPTGEQKGVDVRLGLDLATHGRNHLADVMYLLSGDDDLTEAVEEAQGHGIQVVLLAVPDANGRAHAVSRHLEREADGMELIWERTIDDSVHRPVPTPTRAVAAAAVQATTAVVGDAQEPAESLMGQTPPTPADLARGRANHVLAATPAAPETRSVLAYSTRTGQAAFPVASPDADEAAIDDVCAKVIDSWMLTASDEEKIALLRDRPHVPREIDRALLLDTSDRLGIYELDDSTRVALRARFWVVAHRRLGEPGQ